MEASQINTKPKTIEDWCYMYLYIERVNGPYSPDSIREFVNWLDSLELNIRVL